MIGFLTALTPFLQTIAKPILDRIPDPQERLKAEMEMQSAILANANEMQKLSAQIVKAEASSQHSLTAMWRPITMLSFVAIVVNNYIVAPYCEVLFGVGVRLEVPPDLWEVIKLGLGGYVLGRSGEKMVQTWKQSDKP